MRAFFFAAALIALAVVSLAGADATDRVSRVLPLAAGTPIRVSATVADVTIVGSDRADVRVDIERHAPSRDGLDALPLAIDTAGGVTIGARQRDEGRDPKLRATITIAAPATARVEAVRVFEGRVRVSNLKAACDVELQRGSIEATGLAGRVRLESGLGSVDVRDSELTPGGMMRLRVFNGPLRVRFPRRPPNARILAVTFNGGITSDLPLTKRDEFGPRFGEATLGTGDPVLSMDVVKGDIQLTVDR